MLYSLVLLTLGLAAVDEKRPQKKKAVFCLVMAFVIVIITN